MYYIIMLYDIVLKCIIVIEFYMNVVLLENS